MSRAISMRFPEGRAKTLTFSYDDGVEQDMRFAELLEASVHNGLYIPSKRNKNVINPFGMTVGTFAKSVEGHLSPNTLTFYRSVIEDIIVPSFDKIRSTVSSALKGMEPFHISAPSGKRRQS